MPPAKGRCEGDPERVVGGAPAGAGSSARARAIVLTLYTHPDCHLCEQARARLLELQRELRFELCERDISDDEELQRMYFERVPVVLLEGEPLSEYFVDEALLRERLESRR